MGDSFSAVKAVQYSGGWHEYIYVEDDISTVRDNISTVEGYLQYCRVITAVHVGDTFSKWRVFSTLGDNISTVEITSVLWRVFNTMVDTFSAVGIKSVPWRSLSAVEIKI